MNEADNAPRPTGESAKRRRRSTIRVMNTERPTSETTHNGLSLPAKVALGAFALFGVLTILQWVILSTLRFIQLGLFVVIVVALFGWAVSAKANR